MSNKDSNGFEHPDYEQLRTIDEVDELIEKHRDFLVGKDIAEYRMKDDKKTYVSAINEQLRELKEEREHEMGVLSALDQRRKQIHAGTSNVIPLPPKMNIGN